MANNEFLSGGIIEGTNAGVGNILGQLRDSGEIQGEMTASGNIVGTILTLKGNNGRGITSIEKTGTVDLVDTYTITYTDGDTDTFTVTNGEKGDTGDTGATGNGISSISKTGTSGLVDTYTITYTNGNTTTFTVNNGYSPTANVSKVGGTATITITDSNGTTTSTVDDGYSPIANVSKVGGTSTITITDENGTTTATVDDGYSPTANVDKVGDTATITITDENGTTTATVDDGYSPTITSSKAGKVTTLTITDINGTTTAQILDGADGQGSGDMLKATYDTDENGIVDDSEAINGHVIYTIDYSANSSDIESLAQTVYDAVDSGKKVLVDVQNVIDHQHAILSFGENLVSSGTGSLFLYGQVSSTSTGQTDYGINYSQYKKVTFQITVASDVVTSASISATDNGYMPKNSNVILGMSNTTSYTPSSDYNPATKKYVDDNTKEITYGEFGTSSTPFVFSGKKPGLYSYAKGDAITQYFMGSVSNTTSYSGKVSDVYIIADYDSASNNDVIAYGSNIQQSGDLLQRATFTFKKDTTATSGLSVTKTSNDFAGYFEISNIAQTISAKKTFSVLPESSAAPTSNNQLANKKYVDDSIPTNISAFTNDSGYLTAETDPVFSASAAAGISATNITNWNAKGVVEFEDATVGASSSTPFVFSGKKIGTYSFESGDDTTRYFMGASDDTDTYSTKLATLYILKDYDTANNDDIIAVGDYILRNAGVLYRRVRKFAKKTSENSGLSVTYDDGTIASSICTTNSTQTISAVKTFSALPESSVAPTSNNQLANKKYVDDLIDVIYPVGSIYISTVSTNPGTLFGKGTWVQTSQGRCMIGAGVLSQNTNTNLGELKTNELSWTWSAGQTLGEVYHTLTTSELAKHRHVVKSGGRTNAWAAGNFVNSYQYQDSGQTVVDALTDYTGSDGRHNTMQPSLVVYIWERTA